MPHANTSSSSANRNTASTGSRRLAPAVGTVGRERGYAIISRTGEVTRGAPGRFGRDLTQEQQARVEAISAEKKTETAREQARQIDPTISDVELSKIQSQADIESYLQRKTREGELESKEAELQRAEARIATFGGMRASERYQESRAQTLRQELGKEPSRGDTRLRKTDRTFPDSPFLRRGVISSTEIVESAIKRKADKSAPPDLIEVELKERKENGRLADIGSRTDISDTSRTNRLLAKEEKESSQTFRTEVPPGPLKKYRSTIKERLISFGVGIGKAIYEGGPEPPISKISPKLGKKISETFYVKGPKIKDPDVQLALGAGALVATGAIAPTIGKGLGYSIAGYTGYKLIKEPSQETAAEFTLGVLPVTPKIISKAKFIGKEKVPIEKITYPEVQKQIEAGKVAFPTAKEPPSETRSLALQKEFRKGPFGEGGFHASPEALKGKKVLGPKEAKAKGLEAMEKEPGLYIAPKASTYFLKVTKEEMPSEIKFSLLPKQPTIQHFKVPVERLPSSARSIKEGAKFLKSPEAKGKAFISPAFETYKPEKEAVIGVGTEYKKVPGLTTYEKITGGFKEYTIVRGEKIPIKRYEVIKGKKPQPLERKLPPSKVSAQILREQRIASYYKRGGRYVTPSELSVGYKMPSKTRGIPSYKMPSYYSRMPPSTAYAKSLAPYPVPPSMAFPKTSIMPPYAPPSSGRYAAEYLPPIVPSTPSAISITQLPPIFKMLSPTKLKFDLDIGLRIAKSDKELKVRKYRYTPSLIGIEKGYTFRGKAPKITTGIDIRPVQLAPIRRKKRKKR